MGPPRLGPTLTPTNSMKQSSWLTMFGNEKWYEMINLKMSTAYISLLGEPQPQRIAKRIAQPVARSWRKVKLGCRRGRAKTVWSNKKTWLPEDLTATGQKHSTAGKWKIGNTWWDKQFPQPPWTYLYNEWGKDWRNVTSWYKQRMPSMHKWGRVSNRNHHVEPFVEINEIKN